jgi:hypothetical protein
MAVKMKLWYNHTPAEPILSRKDGRFRKERIKRNPKILPWPSCILLLPRFYQERMEDSERKESNEIQRYCRGHVAYYYLDSIKKGRKIWKGKNQTKSKDIAVTRTCKIHPNGKQVTFVTHLLPTRPN